MRIQFVYYVVFMAALFVFHTETIQAQPYSIYDIQYTTNADGISDYVDMVLDCTGGIVIHKFDGWKYFFRNEEDC